MKRLLQTAILAGMLFALACNAPEPPAPYGAIPSPLQVQWQKMEYYMFVHFGPNTFTDVEWGHGNEDPKVFNPSQLDCRQWARIAKDAGMKAIIVTAKHHDGFCLWPSKFSTHTVRESSWKDGKGDLLRELSDACRGFGLKFGIYISPWDRNHPTYGTDEYNKVFAGTLAEALAGYGQVFEQWFDGANGEGPNGKRQEYDWPAFRDAVRRHQPEALIFGGPCRELRWVGNEAGYAGETNWATLTPNDRIIDAAENDVLGSGMENGTQWLPAEVDVSIRPGWFYSASTDDKVKSLAKLMDIYYSSVGRNGNLLLNVPPDRRGLIHPNDSTRLMELRKALDEAFAVNLAQKASIKADATRGNSAGFKAANLIDGNFDSYWATDDNRRQASLEIDFGAEREFNRLVLQEYIPLGQRVKSFAVDCGDGKQWREIARQTTIGYKRILRFPTVKSRAVRIRIEDALACPALSEIGVYKAQELLSPVNIVRSKKGEVTIFCDSKDPLIRYTTDGSEPSAASPLYSAPVPLPRGGTIKAKAYVDNDSRSSETAVAEFGLAHAKWSLTDAEGRGSDRAIDDNPLSAYILPEKRNTLTVNFGEELSLKGFTYTPVVGSKGNIRRYNLYSSSDGKKWNKIKTNASFDNIANNPVKQFVRFEQPVKASLLRLEAVETVEAGSRVSIGDIGIMN
ncbi:MAG: alpha-L-fucosidase [Prevotellaceae bacterium]|jgi:alpha-L-fucosidase|nr:alpha-L-fucosidase [Prevotellaceae bacterium]